LLAITFGSLRAQFASQDGILLLQSSDDNVDKEWPLTSNRSSANAEMTATSIGSTVPGFIVHSLITCITSNLASSLTVHTKEATGTGISQEGILVKEEIIGRNHWSLLIVTKLDKSTTHVNLSPHIYAMNRGILTTSIVWVLSTDQTWGVIHGG